MNGISAMQSGLAGIQTGMNGLRQNAQTIATQTIATQSIATQSLDTNSNTGAKDVTDALININVNQRQVEASAKIIETQDEMLGTLLDELA